MRIAVGADINGYELKEVVKAHLAAQGHEVIDFGVDGGQDVDYPEVAEPVARAVARGEVDRAVLVCGTGLGMAIVANKVRGVRAAPVTDPYSAERAIRSNDARVLCLGGLVTGRNVAPLLVDHWLSGEFAGGNSGRKVAKIEDLDQRERV
ncbi:MAG TPA: ribose 5-phosphate isomerase B [Candidatus Limnocylindrales bacterium]|nr:ribose 5-phosphate isomerase B [Candidatus Limnocylindrales bacterium]